MSCDPPYISIVAVSRNDDHGAGLLQRMQHFIDCLYEQVNQAKIPVELVLVEWNPPEDRPSLHQVLSWPPFSEFFSARIITVPPKLHKKFQNAEKLPLFQMIGKNVGIRRAKGQYILATNIDIIFSSELIRFIALKKLEPGVFYRVNRIDVDSNIPVGKSLDEKLEFCRTHVIRVNSKYYLASTSNFRALVLDIAHNPSLIGYYLINLIDKLRIPRLHYNACGDFTLMAKEDWEMLNGYPELEMYSLHIDSLLLMMASYSGLRECTLHAPKEIYHIEHSIGSGVTPGTGQKKLFQRLEQQGIPFLSWRDCINYIIQYKKRCGDTNYTIKNMESTWGLSGLILPENQVTG
jgi:hypothetical protein